MDDAGGLPVLELLERHAEVSEEVSVREFDPTVGGSRRNGRGKAIDDLRKREVVFHSSFDVPLQRSSRANVKRP